MIIIKDWVAQVPEEERQLAYVGENETVVRELLLTDAGYEAYTFYMDMAFDLSTVTAHQTHQEEKSDDVTTEVLAESGSTVTAQKSKESRTVTQTTVDCQSPTDIAPLEKRVAADGVHLLWTVLAQHTRLPGLLRATVRAVGPDGQVKKTAILHLTVGAAVAATPAVPVEKSEFEQIEQQLAGRMETFRSDITALSDEAAASAQAAALRAAEAAQDAQSAAAGAATATEKAASAADSATSAADSATAAAASETKAAGSEATATKKAAAAAASASSAATSASSAAASKTAAAASEAAAKTAAAEAKAVVVPLEPAGAEKKSVQSKGHKNKITGKISGSAAFGNGNVLEGDYHDWQFAAGWQNRSRGNNTLNFGSRNIVEGHNGANIGQDNESRDYNGHNIGFQNVAGARQTGNVGTGLLTDTPEQIAVGTTNAPNADAVLMVGNGDVHRRNAMTVSRDGKITVGGHFEEAVLENPGVATVEMKPYFTGSLYSLNSDGNQIIGVDAVSDSGGAVRAAAIVRALHAAGGTRAQMLVKAGDAPASAPVQIEAGKGYRIRFYVLAKTPYSFPFRYWLTADTSTTCYTSTAQKNAAVIYETEGIPVTGAKWVRVECTIPAAAHGGNLRLGVAGYVDANHQSTEFYLSDIAVCPLADVPVYRVADGGGDAYSGTLCKIAELQTARAQSEWLIGRAVVLRDGSKYTITEAEVSSGNLGDGNTYYAKDGQILLLCVDRIGTDKQGAPWRGIYAADTVKSVSYKKWVDAPPVDVSAITFANALRGKKQGGTVRIDDAAPVQHEMALRVNGKNLVPYPYRDGSKTINGVTFTVNEDGTVTANGTSTEDTTFVLHNMSGLAGLVHFPKGKYSLSGVSEGSYSTYYMNVAFFNNGAKIVDTTFTSTKTIDLPQDADALYIGLQIKSGVSVSNRIFSPQIEAGDAATAYEPYIPPTAMRVQRYGKNLVPYPYQDSTKTINGITFTVNKDRSITVNGTATATANFLCTALTSMPLSQGTYTLSSGLSNDNAQSTFGVALGYKIGSENRLTAFTVNGVQTITLTETAMCDVVLVVRANQTLSNVVFRPQVEVGNAATAYEPYIPPTEHTPAADGTVAGVLTLDPTITLTTDSAGTVLEAEYSRDVNKAFAALQAAVEALQS